MRPFKTTKGAVLQCGQSFQFVDADWNSLIIDDDLHERLGGVEKKSDEGARAAVTALRSKLTASVYWYNRWCAAGHQNEIPQALTGLTN